MPTVKLTGLSALGQVTGIGDTDDAQLDSGLIVGNADTDSIVINAEFDSDLIPDDDATYDLGSETKRWNNIAAVTYYGDGSNLDGVGGEPDGLDGQIQYKNVDQFGGAGQFFYKSGKVGIGDFQSDDPISALHIKGNFGGGQNLGVLSITDYGSSPSIIFGRYNGNSQSFSAPVNSQSLGQIAFSGYNSVANALEQGAIIKAQVDGTPNESSADMPTALFFSTAGEGSSIATARMVVKSTGKVGINTFEPTYQLEVKGDGIRADSSSQPKIAIARDQSNPPTATLLGQLRFGNLDNNQASSKIEALTAEDWNTSWGSFLSFSTTQIGSTTATEAMRVSANGIDMYEDTDIQANLDVSGNSVMSGNLNVSGNLNLSGILDVNDHIRSEEYVKVHNDLGYVSVQAVSTGIESKLSLSTLETGSVYANAYLTNSDMNSAITSMVTMMAWSVTDNAIQMNATGKSARFEVYDDNSQPAIAMNENGKVYLGTLNGEPQYPNFEFQTGNGVHIEGNDSDDCVLVVVNRSVDDASDGIAIILGEGAHSHSQGTTNYPTDDNRFIKFYTKKKPYNSPNDLPANVPEQIGSIRGDNFGGVDYVESFTGLHASVIETAEITTTGLIIESTGEIWHSATGDNVSTALPKVTLSSTAKSKRVFGVIARLNGSFDGYVSASPLKESETHIEVNSLGEGKVWITNINGNIENGDYITSSEISGYGMLQDDDLLHNYTVAKCTENIDWDSVSEIIEHNGQTYKKYLSACTYHCG